MQEVSAIKQRWDMVTLLFLAIFLMVFVLCHPMVAASLGQKALILAAKNVVPSLFVYAVGAKLLVGANISGLLCRLPTGALRRFLGVSEAGLAAVLVGLFAGFPVGASMLAAFVKRGEMERAEAEALMPFCNGASASFVIGTVGGVYFHSVRIGVLLLVSQIMATLCALILTAKKRRAFLPIRAPISAENAPFFSVFSGAVSEGASAMVSVTGFIVFFSVLSGAVSYLVMGEGTLFSAVIASVLEISGGLSALSALTLEERWRVTLSAFFLGLGGFSVMMQAADRADAAGISMRCYPMGKLLCACLGAALAFFLR